MIRSTRLAMVVVELLAAALLVAGVAAAADLKSGVGTMPNRLSMSFTVSKQTQRSTFGEKVATGLQSAGSAVAQGADLTIGCGATMCAVALPDGSGVRADLDGLTLAPLAKNRTAPPSTGPAVADAGIVSVTVSSIDAAASGRRAGAPLASRRRDDAHVDVTDPLVDGDYLLTVVVEKATSGLKDVIKTQVRTVAPQRVRIDLVFSVESGVLKVRHDTAKNAIGNIR